MPHRSPKHTLRERRDQLLAQLAAIELLDEDELRADFLRELEDVVASLHLLTPRRRLPLLESLRLVRGCSASWEGMVSDAHVRHCGACDRQVYDLTALDPDEIEAFLRERKDALPCLQLHVRPDGRYQDGPCGPAERRALVRAGTLALTLGLSGVVALLSASGSSIDEGVRASVLEPREDPEAAAREAEALLLTPFEGPMRGVGRLDTSTVPGGSSLGLAAAERRRGRFAAEVAASEGYEGMGERLERSVSTRRAALTRCYETALRRDPELSGVITLSLRALGSGSIVSVRSEQSSDLDAVGSCAVRIVQGIRLAPTPAETLALTTEGAPFVITLTFEPLPSSL
jgi:hypothetical protein